MAADKMTNFFLFALLGILSISQVCAIHSLADFDRLLMSQPERMILQKKNKKLETTFSCQDFLKTMEASIASMVENFLDKNKWLNQRTAPSKKETSSHALFGPYVQKVVVPSESQVACWGDLHGSAHSLVRCLQYLNTLGYLQDDFSIAPDHPNFYFMFLGDYVDRGCYGIEVLYLLMKLKIVNPDRVFIVRGNHENVPANRFWGFGQELQAKYANAFDLAVLSDFFTLLPLACYFGCESIEDGTKDFILCCHGGPDMGFDPMNFLSSPKSINFQKIEAFNYKSYFDKKIKSLKLSAKQLGALHNQKKKALEKGIRWTDEKNVTADSWLMKYGFIWTDFDVYEENEDLLKFTKRCWLLGKSITHALLETSHHSIKVHAVVRGHQHHDRLYDDLVRKKGFMRSWNGLVNTLFSGPASKTFAHKRTDEQNFDYDSFVIIKTAQAFKQWSYTHWWHEVTSDVWHSNNGLLKNS